MRASSLADELRIAEEQASEVDAQNMALEQQTVQMRHTMAELEISYRRCLLESQKAHDAVEALMEQLREEMGITDPKALSRYAISADAEREGVESENLASSSNEL